MLRSNRLFLSVATLLVASVALTGCGLFGDEPAEETPARTFDNSVKEPREPVAPPPPMLNSARTAVYSYLVWISYAYMVLDSDVATHAFSQYEEVRVNSYVEYNKQQGRAIDQELLKLDFTGDEPTKEETATIGATEVWKYRYISIKSGKYDGDWMDVTYDSTYTVVFDPKTKKWLVDSVAATPRGEIK